MSDDHLMATLDTSMNYFLEYYECTNMSTLCAVNNICKTDSQERKFTIPVPVTSIHLGVSQILQSACHELLAHVSVLP